MSLLMYILYLESVLCDLLEFNPLMPETFMPSNFEMYPKIGSHRPPTHRRGAHRKFFSIPSFFQNEILIIR